MNRFLIHSSCAAALLLIACVAAADDYAAARDELVAAYQEQDYAAMVDAARRAMTARPEHPGARFNLALASALNGDSEASLENLVLLLERGADFGAHEMDEFAALRSLPGWSAYLDAVEKLHQPVGDAEIAFRLEADRFVPEGIAIDASGNVYLGSIRKGQLTRNGEVLSDRQGHWSIFGMRFHKDGGLWFASAAVPQLEGVGHDLGKTGLFRLDPESGEITHTAILPQRAERQVLGDLVIHGDVIFTSDSLTGAIHAYDVARGAWRTLVEPGVLRSPQGLVLDATGDILYVADYSTGIYAVRLSEPTPQRISVPLEATDYGIDGLYRHGSELIAIQNGVRPHRVLTFKLEDGGLRVSRSRVLAANLPEFDEPSLGVVHDSDFYFVANSHWNRFDRENNLPDGLAGPIVLKLALGEKQD